MLVFTLWLNHALIRPASQVKPADVAAISLEGAG